MKFKHFAAYLIVIVLALAMTSCTTAVSYADDLEDEAPLNIYLITRMTTDNYVCEMVDRYNQSRPDGERKIVVTKFEDMDTMYTRILREISTGGGPDILCINEHTDDYIDIHKIAKQGGFADMDILIENSETFDFSAYNEGALEAGIIDEKRIMMPLGYTVPYLVSVEENFIYNQLDIPNKMTWDTYLDLMDTYYQNTENKPACWGIDPVYVLAEYIETGELIEKTPELQHLFELLKTEHRYMPNMHKIDFYTFENWLATCNIFIQNHYLFYESVSIRLIGFTPLKQFHEKYNFIENANDSKMLWYSQPLKEKDAPKAYVENLLAINVNSKHKNEAFEFVEFTLSKQMQSMPFLKHDLDVNVKSYQQELKDFKEGYNSLFNRSDVIIETHVPDDMVNDFVAHLDSIQTYEYIGEFKYLYQNVFYESIQSYYNDHITFDEMNNKMAIYLSE